MRHGGSLSLQEQILPAQSHGKLAQSKTSLPMLVETCMRNLHTITILMWDQRESFMVPSWLSMTPLSGSMEKLPCWRWNSVPMATPKFVWILFLHRRMRTGFRCSRWGWQHQSRGRPGKRYLGACYYNIVLTWTKLADQRILNWLCIQYRCQRGGLCSTIPRTTRVSSKVNMRKTRTGSELVWICIKISGLERPLANLNTLLLPDHGKICTISFKLPVICHTARHVTKGCKTLMDQITIVSLA